MMTYRKLTIMMFMLIVLTISACSRVVEQLDGPTDITLSNLKVAEKQMGIDIGTVSVVDSSVGDSFVLTVKGPDKHLVEIRQNVLKLRDTVSLDMEINSFIAIIIQAIDSQNNNFEKPFVIDVMSNNKPPTNIELSNTTINSNVTGLIIADITVSDIDIGDMHTVSLSGLDKEYFEIVDNQLKFKSNYSAQNTKKANYNVVIEVTDTSQHYLFKEFNLVVSKDIMALNREDLSKPQLPPSDIIVSSLIIPENNIAFQVATINIQDSDPDEYFQLTLSGKDADFFELTGTTLNIKELMYVDYETNATLELTITATNSKKLALSKTFTFTVLDLIEPVSGIWRTLNNMPGFTTGIATNPIIKFYNDDLYMSYQDSATGNRVSMMKYDGTQFTSIGTGITHDDSQFPDMVINPTTGEIVIAYLDTMDTSPVSSFIYNGTTWSQLGSRSFTPIDLDFIDLEYDDNKYYVSFIEVRNFNKASVYRYESGKWQPHGNTAFSPGASEFNKLEIVNGKPYVAFKDYANSMKMSVMMFNGLWLNVGPAGFTDGSVEDLDLEADGNILYVAFSDNSVAGKCTVMKYESNTWSIVGKAGFSDGAVTDVELLFVNNVPYVVYRDGDMNNYVSLMRYNGYNWEYVGSRGFSGGTGNMPDIISKNNRIYVSFQDDNAIRRGTIMYIDL